MGQVLMTQSGIPMPADLTGEFAALGTALFFAFGSTLFTLSGRMIGSPLVNRGRLFVAIFFVVALHWLSFGEPFPLGAGTEPWFWLGLSGFVGLAMGDAFLFQAFVMIGPRLSMLVMALAPVLSVIMAWLFLGENLKPQDLLGISLTVVGIAWVVSERNAIKPSASVQVTSRREYIIGLIFAFGGAMGQAGGLILSKVGLANDFPALSGNLIRLTVAVIAVWALTAFRGQIVSSFKTMRANPRPTLFLSIGAVTGPVLGVWLSLIAVQRAPVGIASTLMALTPIFLLPISRIVFKEKISRPAIIGTLIAFAGTALLFL